MMWSLHNFLLICAPFHRKRRQMVNKYFQPCACYCTSNFWLNHQHSHDNNHQHLVAKEGTLPSAHWMARCTSRKSLISTLPQPFFSPSVIALSQFYSLCASEGPTESVNTTTANNKASGLLFVTFSLHISTPLETRQAASLITF